MLYALTSTLTETLTNNSVAIIMTPWRSASRRRPATIRPLIVAVMFAASASFATPIGHQTNTMVYAAADYRSSYFVKIGFPMNVTMVFATCAANAWLIA